MTDCRPQWRRHIGHTGHATGTSSVMYRYPAHDMLIVAMIDEDELDTGALANLIADIYLAKA